jgi:hypothetical protein
VPIKPMSRLEQLIAEGRARPARYSLRESLRRYPPVPRPPGMPSLSEILAEMRADER